MKTTHSLSPSLPLSFSASAHLSFIHMKLESSKARPTPLNRTCADFRDSFNEPVHEDWFGWSN